MEAKKQEISVELNSPESVLGALTKLFKVRKFRQARVLLNKLTNLAAKAKAKAKINADAQTVAATKPKDWFYPILMLVSKGYYQEAAWLMSSYEKYTGANPAAHFGNPLHVSFQATESAQKWEEFFTKSIAPQEVIAEVFEKSITTEHKAAVDAWRANNPAPKCITFGSCFAREIANAISDLGYQSETLHLEESINTPKATLEILDLILTGNGNEFLKEKIQGRETAILQMLKAANIIVTTVGVGFYYVDRNDQLYLGEGYGKKIKAGEIRPVFPPVEEHIDSIIQIHDKLMEFNPGALKIITLSPVPLSGYIGEPGMFVADCVSKSSLRAAIFHAIDKTSFVYLPTFEALKWISPHMPAESSFRPFVDPRHPNEFLVAAILSYLLPKANEKQGA